MVGSFYLQIKFAARRSVPCGKCLFASKLNWLHFPTYKLFANLFSNLILRGKIVFQARSFLLENSRLQARISDHGLPTGKTLSPLGMRFENKLVDSIKYGNAAN